MSTYLFTEDYNETVLELAKRFNLYDENDVVRWSLKYLAGDKDAPYYSSAELTLSGNWREEVEEANR